MTTALLILVILGLVIALGERGYAQKRQRELIDRLREQRDAAVDGLHQLKTEIAERGLLHAPKAVEVVLGNATFERGHRWPSTRAFLRAVGRPSDSHLPPANSTGTILVGDLLVKRVDA